jgi:predicted solute-binding protein
LSKVTIVGSVTYAVEVDIPLGFLVDERELARQQTKELKRTMRASTPAGSKLLDVQATHVVVAGPRW